MAIDPNIKNKAQKIRTEIYGKDVRESLASGLEAMSEDVVQNKNRQDTVEQQFQDVLDETTDKDFNSAPEIKAARGGHGNLSQRLLSTDQQLQQTEQELNAQLAQITAHISPTGTGDDTQLIQQSLNEFRSVSLRKGIYHIDSSLLNTMNFPNDRVLIFEEGAEFHVIPSEVEEYRCIHINNAKNITIYNPYIIGDLDYRTHDDPSVFQYGLGIAIYYSENINIYGGYVSKTNGSGVSILDSKDVYIQRLVADRAYTNGFSLISGENITLDNCEGTRSKGTNPEAGLDIEPNNNTEVLKNINIINFKSKDCAGAGINISIDKMAGATTEVSITIDNPVDVGSGFGFWLGRITPSQTGKLTGRININKLSVNKNKKNGLIIRNYGADNTPSVLFDKPSIIDSNQFGSTTYLPEACGLTFFRGVNEGEGYLMGNVTINQPEIVDTANKMRFGVFLRDEIGNGFKKFKILNPIDITGFSNLQERFFCDTNGLILKDELGILSVPNDYINAHRIITNITNKNLDTQKNITIQGANTLNVYDFTIENIKEGILGISLPIGTKVYPLSQNTIRQISTSTKGAKLTLRKISFLEYEVVNIVGDWTAVE